MQVILLESIAKLGSLGEQIHVKAGYGRNFLIPQQKAVLATKDNIAHFEIRRAELQEAADVTLAEARRRATEIEALDIVIGAKAGAEGKLFGSVTVRDIVAAMTAKNVTLEKSEVNMPKGPIRELGAFDIGIRLHPEVIVSLKINVTAEA